MAGLPTQGQHVLRRAALCVLSHLLALWPRLLQSPLAVLLQTDGSPPTSTFERELSEYLACLGLPAEHRDHAALLCREHDFSAARVHLVVSRPGRHTGAELLMLTQCFARLKDDRRAAASDGWLLALHHLIFYLKWSVALMRAGPKLNSYGHMALRRLLTAERFPDTFLQAPMIAQFSSLGSLKEDWLREFRHSMACGLTSSGMLSAHGVSHMSWSNCYAKRQAA